MTSSADEIIRVVMDAACLTPCNTHGCPSGRGHYTHDTAPSVSGHGRDTPAASRRTNRDRKTAAQGQSVDLDAPPTPRASDLTT